MNSSINSNHALGGFGKTSAPPRIGEPPQYDTPVYKTIKQKEIHENQVTFSYQFYLRYFFKKMSSQE